MWRPALWAAADTAMVAVAGKGDSNCSPSASHSRENFLQDFWARRSAVSLASLEAGFLLGSEVVLILLMSAGRPCLLDPFWH